MTRSSHFGRKHLTMNKSNILLPSLLCLAANVSISAQETQDIQAQVSQLSSKVERISTENARLNTKIDNVQAESATLKIDIAGLTAKCDSAMNALDAKISSNVEQTKANHTEATAKIQSVETTSQTGISHLALWGVVAVAILLIVSALVYILLRHRVAKGTTAISSIRAAQDNIKEAQDNLKEESVKLDTKLVTSLTSRWQLSEQSECPAETAGVDHSLALKVADEIARIELNMSRMDSSIKGYRQLSRAVQRIKDNFKSKGYDIVDMLGKPYNEGMRVVANFIPDDTLEEGKQIITGITKPQVNYNGKMIQAAEITVSQNI